MKTISQNYTKIPVKTTIFTEGMQQCVKIIKLPITKRKEKGIMLQVSDKSSVAGWWSVEHRVPSVQEAGLWRFTMDTNIKDIVKFYGKVT